LTAIVEGSARNAFLGTGFVLIGATLMPWSAAIVQPVFAAVGPSASSAGRFLLGALVLVCIARPQLRGWTRHQWTGAIIFGVATAFMNQCFYQAIARIPLGSAVAIEFLGPFLVAALGKRSWRHFGFVVLAGFGVVALSRPGGGLTLVGGLFAVGAGIGWASYLFASHRVGGSTVGLDGLAVAMAVAALVTLPMSLGSAHVFVHHPLLLGRLLIVAVMSIVLGFGAELQALRRLKPAIVGVLMAFNPAIAFLIGWLLLSEHVTAWVLVGLLSVVLGGVGVTLDQARRVELAPQ
jgi:inner membrane transporter RhtA